jgi:acetyltransferase-like isoleucine patch superfamily enzyme
MGSLKQFLKRLLKPVMLRLVRLVINDVTPQIRRQLKRLDAKQGAARAENLLKQLGSVGAGVILDPTVQITDPLSVVIANNVTIGAQTVLLSNGGLTIGENTVMGSGVRVYTYDHLESPQPVHIGRNVWIGDNSLILPGVWIGDGAVILPGAVVKENVPPGQREIPISHSPRRRTGDQMDGNIFFVVSTGRAGSKTMAGLLSQHPDVTCIHEHVPQLVRLSSEYAYSWKTREQVKAELIAIYLESKTYPSGFYGESNQKLFNLFPILAELFPRAKFIWLMRDGRNVVASYASHERGIFSPEEHAQGSPIIHGWRRWAYYRLEGNKCGVFSDGEWAVMSRFERACWFWYYVNNQIENHLQELPTEQWMSLKLETLAEQIPDIYRLLGASPLPTEVLHLNKAWYPKNTWENWSAEQHALFEKWCGTMMDRLYPDWRDAVPKPADVFS